MQVQHQHALRKHFMKIEFENSVPDLGVCTVIFFFRWCVRQMVQVGLCTLLAKLDKSAFFTVISKDNTCVLRNYFVS